MTIPIKVRNNFTQIFVSRLSIYKNSTITIGKSNEGISYKHYSSNYEKFQINKK